MKDKNIEDQILKEAHELQRKIHKLLDEYKYKVSLKVLDEIKKNQLELLKLLGEKD